MPCLNEAETIGTCIRKSAGFLKRTGIAGDILIADNTDGSRQIAEIARRRVVAVLRRRALRRDRGRAGGWRTLKFLLMYSPRWLYLVPGIVFLTFGTLLALALLFGPVKLANVVLDLNTLLVACALAIVDVQLLTFGVLSRYYAIGAGFLPSSGRTERLPRNEASPGEGGQPLLCPTSKRLLVTPHSFALEIEMLYERRLAVIFRSSVASIKLRFSSRE